MVDGVLLAPLVLFPSITISRARPNRSRCGVRGGIIEGEDDIVESDVGPIEKRASGMWVGRIFLLILDGKTTELSFVGVNACKAVVLSEEDQQSLFMAAEYGGMIFSLSLVEFS